MAGYTADVLPVMLPGIKQGVYAAECPERRCVRTLKLFFADQKK